MLCYARLEVEGRDPEKIIKSLKPDDPEWCKCWAERGKIIIEVEVKKIGTLLSALDDYLMNIKMCLKILEELNFS
ncbi:hypothetical protein B6U96_14540 [Archaeoglobales archaeon ex4484_92]|nr:MAG: hypothetical protein B6U96_14540 [Archaeoglobales archaeon ex4484_92]RLG18304.1 MAG: hypothetical protein DRN63_01660 [Nanoarchaeota archaeon]HDN73810.1 hypothetical protein [Archaeoglobus sp.]